MLAELTQTEIEALLRQGSIGRIGCRQGDQVYIVPVNYTFEAGCINCWSLEGIKLQMMRENPDVCFEVEDIADEQNWKTVICWGMYEEVIDEAEVALLRQQYTEYVLRKRATVTLPPPVESAMRARPDQKPGPPVWYRIRLTKFSGRMEVAL